MTWQARDFLNLPFFVCLFVLTRGHFIPHSPAVSGLVLQTGDNTGCPLAHNPSQRSGEFGFSCQRGHQQDIWQKNDARTDPEL